MGSTAGSAPSGRHLGRRVGRPGKLAAMPTRIRLRARIDASPCGRPALPPSRCRRAPEDGVFVAVAGEEPAHVLLAAVSATCRTPMHPNGQCPNSRTRYRAAWPLSHCPRGAGPPTAGHVHAMSDFTRPETLRIRASRPWAKCRSTALAGASGHGVNRVTNWRLTTARSSRAHVQPAPSARVPNHALTRPPSRRGRQLNRRSAPIWPSRATNVVDEAQNDGGHGAGEPAGRQLNRRSASSANGATLADAAWRVRRRRLGRRQRRRRGGRRGAAR